MKHELKAGIPEEADLITLAETHTLKKIASIYNVSISNVSDGINKQFEKKSSGAWMRSPERLSIIAYKNNIRL